MSGVRKNEQSEHRFTILDAALDFKAFKASVAYGNSHNLIHRLNEWYRSLWEGEQDD